jgi:hypothetical protein
MRETGLLTFEEGGSQRVFYEWHCVVCLRQAATKAAVPPPDPNVRRREG